MKEQLTLFVFIFLALHLHAQQAPFFNDEFDSNKNNWFTGEIKKSALQFHDGKYSVYNDWGKSAIVSLIDLPFDEKKNYHIQSEMEEGYIPPYSEGRYGVMFAAKDEKNGYALLLDRTAVCYFVKIENGKVSDLNRNSNIDGKSDGGVIHILLDNLRWQFKIDNRLIYSCSPMPWMGHKAGFYCSAESGYSALNLIIEESIPGPNPCPLPFTTEQLNEQLSRIICAAPDDFAALQSEQSDNVSGFEIWKPKDISLNGATDIFLAKGSNDSGKKGKDFIITLGCSDVKDKDQGAMLFEQLVEAMNHVKPPCTMLKQKEISENLADFLLKAVTWDADIKIPSSGTVRVRIELDFNKFDSAYYTNIHVNVPE